MFRVEFTTGIEGDITLSRVEVLVLVRKHLLTGCVIEHVMTGLARLRHGGGPCGILLRGTMIVTGAGTTDARGEDGGKLSPLQGRGPREGWSLRARSKNHRSNSEPEFVDGSVNA